MLDIRSEISGAAVVALEAESRTPTAYREDIGLAVLRTNVEADVKSVVVLWSSWSDLDC